MILNTDGTMIQSSPILFTSNDIHLISSGTFLIVHLQKYQVVDDVTTNATINGLFQIGDTIKIGYQYF